MTHSNLGTLNLGTPNLAAINSIKLTDCRFVDRNSILESQIKAVILALGSNFKADKHLAIARDELEKCALVKQWSTPFVNADYTATPMQPKPDYSNQCGYLTLCSETTLQQLIASTKGIEALCRRLTLPKNLDNTKKTSRVSVDIDVLAVQVAEAGQWQIIKQRYPFKEHEWVGVNELLKLLDIDT